MGIISLVRKWFNILNAYHLHQFCYRGRKNKNPWDNYVEKWLLSSIQSSQIKKYHIILSNYNCAYNKTTIILFILKFCFRFLQFLPHIADHPITYQPKEPFSTLMIISSALHTEPACPYCLYSP